jgi:DNA polymerase-3 subunit gamma/tau
MDRLLELIDQFAAAEGRMKWAPNKKLHFEVAIIKAIQSLGQATLDEVIEKLGELREGGGKPPAGAPPTRPAPVAAGVSPTPTRAAGPATVASAKADDRGQAKPMPQKAGVTAPGYSKTRMEDKTPSVNPPVDSENIWKSVLTKIPAQKAFVRNSASAAHVLGVEGRNFKLGFAVADKATMDILDTQANRKFIETLLHEISGKDWTLKLTVNEELASKTAVAAEEPTSVDFKNEPLIQEAIELFNARVRS